MLNPSFHLDSKDGQPETGSVIAEISEAEMKAAMRNHTDAIRAKTWWTHFIPMSLVAVYASLGNIPGYFWMLLGVNLAIYLAAELRFLHVYNCRKKSQSYRASERLSAALLFAEGLSLSLLLLPYASAIDPSKTSYFILTVVIVTVAFAYMLNAADRRYVVSHLSGFAGGGLLLCALFFHQGGAFELLAITLASPTVLLLTNYAREQIREIIITQLENEHLSRMMQSMLHDTKRLADHDPLTGLLNRRAFEEAVQTSYADKHASSECALILVDLDYFKTINDVYGHNVGDTVLKATAASMTNTIRDFVGSEKAALARWGGEEFIVALQVDSFVEAVEIAECLRNGIAEARDDDWSPDMLVSGSVGVALWDKDQDLHDIINEADKAMYSAKVAGRNRTRAFHKMGCLPLDFIKAEAKLKTA